MPGQLVRDSVDIFPSSSLKWFLGDQVTCFDSPEKNVDLNSNPYYCRGWESRLWRVNLNLCVTSRNLMRLIKGAYKLVCGMMGAGPFLGLFRAAGRCGNRHC